MEPSSHSKTQVAPIEYAGALSLKQKTIITKLDNQGQLSITVLNSMHTFYCQALFTNFETGICISVKLLNFVNPEESPAFDQSSTRPESKGKSTLVVDDVSWTQNDAFVILLFSTCTLAILPRLGNCLVAFFNPALQNISTKQVDLCQHYRTPRCFNELVLPQTLTSKYANMKERLIASRKTIYYHPQDDIFILSDGSQVFFTFSIDYDHDITELFGKQNMPYFFIRFCISLERLAVEPDILEKIPHLLTSRLPLFEFEKNAELDEEEDPGQIILTASQINPFETGLKPMETNQSFNAEFKLDSQVVLVNLKHLLMGLRWNKSSPINYFQWIVTVVNDCFFYFLKNSEPLYAYHALRMSESYIKNYLFKTDDGSDRSPTQSQTFESLVTGADPVHNMYDYHQTQDYMTKSTLDKILVSYSMFQKVPLKLKAGSGNWRFQFTKNYTLLVYYSLIQFRNYQAANFNILFLVFACYIIQRYLDGMMVTHITSIVDIVRRNFMLKKKTDDYELFLGKQGKNVLVGAPEKFQQLRDWTTQIVPNETRHLAPLFQTDNYDNLIDSITSVCILNGSKAERNLGYLGDTGSPFLTSLMIEQVEKTQKGFDDLIKGFRERVQSEEKSDGWAFARGMELYLITKSLVGYKVSSLSHLIKEVMYLPYKVESIEKRTHLPFDHIFKKAKLPECLIQLGLNDKEQKLMLSTLYLYLGDMQMASDVLPIQHRICMLSSLIKTCFHHTDTIRQKLEHRSIVDLKTLEEIGNKYEEYYCAQQIKRAAFLINQCAPDSTDLICTLSLIPGKTAVVARERLLQTHLLRMSKILKFIKLGCSISGIVNPKNKAEPLTGRRMLMEICETASDTLILEVFKTPLLLEEFQSSLEKVVFVFISCERRECFASLVNSQLKLSDDVAEDQPTSLFLTKSFRKLCGILMYLKERVRLNALEKALTRTIDEIALNFKLSLFEKYSHSQLLISKGLTLLKERIGSEGRDWHHVVQNLSFSALNRQNKQKFAAILDAAKAANDSLVQHLENIMFSAQEGNQKETLQKIKMTFAKDVINVINNKIDIGDLCFKAKALQQSIKVEMLDISLKVRDLFGLSFDTAFYFERNNFLVKEFGHPLGLSNKLLDTYREIKQSMTEKEKPHDGEEKRAIDSKMEEIVIGPTTPPKTEILKLTDIAKALREYYERYDQNRETERKDLLNTSIHLPKQTSMKPKESNEPTVEEQYSTQSQIARGVTIRKNSARRVIDSHVSQPSALRQIRRPSVKTSGMPPLARPVSKRQRLTTKEQALQRLGEIQSTSGVRLFFLRLKFSEAKPRFCRLLLVKKQADKYSVQEVRDLLKQPPATQGIEVVRLNSQGQIIESHQLKPPNIKEEERKKRPAKPKRQHIQNLRTLKERIEKVQREMTLLSTEFARANH